jgi:hypothetical protein
LQEVLFPRPDAWTGIPSDCLKSLLKMTAIQDKDILIPRMKLTGIFSNALGALGVVLPLLGTAFAQTSAPPAQASSSFAPIVFPARGQTQQQMDKDKTDCYAWAKNQTGFDPVAASLQANNQPVQTVTPPVQTAPPPPPPPQGNVVRGGARGAAGGAAVGAIAGDAGKGAAIGAVAGGAVSGIRQRRAGQAQQEAAAQQQAAQNQAALDQQAAQQQAAAQQTSANQQKLDAYKRAFQACMEGKGYTVR